MPDHFTQTIRRAILGTSLLLATGTHAPDAFADDAPAGWKAGVASVVITPDQNMWMAGYASRNKPSEGTAQDLFAKALAIEDASGKRLVIVTADLIGIPRSLRDSLVARVQERFDLPAEALLLNASHTHCGPELRATKASQLDLGEDRVSQARAYLEQLESKLLGIIGEALEGLEPAQLGYSHARCGFAMNRRLLTDRGYVIGPAPEGPVDHSVPVLRVADSDGALRAVLFGYACHNTTLSFYEFCGDYAGYAQQYLEEAHPGATAMFLTGCGGDQNPYPRRTLEQAQWHGRSLATAVEAALEARPRPIIGDLQLTVGETALPFAPPPTRDELLKRRESQDRYERRHAERLLEELESTGRIRDEYPYLVQIVRFGDDLTLVALAGEVVVDYSLRLKRELTADGDRDSGPAVWIAGYSNDVFGYVPSRRVLEEGGYEAGGAMRYTAFPGPFAPEVEEQIIGQVHELLGERRGADSR